MANVGWMELAMMLGILAVLVGLVTLLVLAARTSAQSAGPELVGPDN
jgi:hypothetical protein